MEEVLVVGDVLGSALGDGHFEVVPEPLDVIALEVHSIDPTSVGVYPVARRLPEVVTDHKNGLTASEVDVLAAQLGFLGADVMVQVWSFLHSGLDVL